MATAHGRASHRDRCGNYERNTLLPRHQSSIQNLIDYLEGGHPLSEFLRQFPTITHDMAVQALEENRQLVGSCLP